MVGFMNLQACNPVFFWSAVFYRSLIQPTAVTLGSKGIEAVAQILVGDGLRGLRSVKSSGGRQARQARQATSSNMSNSKKKKKYEDDDN